MSNLQETHIKDDEVSLKAIILKTQEFLQKILQGWLFILILTIPFLVYFYHLSKDVYTTYQASLTFMVNEDQGPSSATMSILNQFVGRGGGGGGKSNLERIIELSRSRKIIQNSLLNKVEINGKTDFLANHLIDIYNIQENMWNDSDSKLAGFYFTHDDFENFTLVENSAIKVVKWLIIGGEDQPPILYTGINEDTDIMTLKATSKNEEFSIKWLKSLFEELSQYYIDKSTEKQQATYDIVKNKVDSIRLELTQAEARLARFKDGNRGLYSEIAKLGEERLFRDLQVLAIMYKEAVQNKEIAEFSLNNKTPFVQAIDIPIAPLMPIEKSKVVYLIIGALLGITIGVLLIVVRKIFQDAMNSDG